MGCIVAAGIWVRAVAGIVAVVAVTELVSATFVILRRHFRFYATLAVPLTHQNLVNGALEVAARLFCKCPTG